MTLQLEVGKTYRARNGGVVRIVEKAGGPHERWPFLGDAGFTYLPNGSFWGYGPRDEDLIEEISPPSPASELDAAIAKFEKAWSDAKQAMDKAQLAAEDVAQAIRAAREPTNVQG